MNILMQKNTQTVKAVSKLSGNIGILWMWPNIDAGTDETSKIMKILSKSS